MKIRAAVLRASGLPSPFASSRPLEVRDIELAGPDTGEVLVKIEAAGLCHSDLSVVTGDRPRPMPMVLGHESSGEVIECGAGVTDLRPGDRVVMVFMPSCGTCMPCMEGRPALCEPGAASNAAGTLLSGNRRLSMEGAPVHHHVGVSCFAEYAVVSRRSCIKLEGAASEISAAEAALFGCAVLTGAGAAINTAQVRAGSSVAVVGLGGVGFSALLASVASGANPVLALDLNDEKLAFARELGATATIRADAEDAAEMVREMSQGGVHYALEMAGAVAAMDLAWRITRRGGTTVTAGLPHPDRRFAIPPVQLVGEERTLRGSYIGSSVPARDIPRYIGLYLQGKLPVNRLMGQRMRLDEINAGLDRLASGTAMRDLVIL